MGNRASQWAVVSLWRFPVTLVLLGGVSFVRRYRMAGSSLVLAGLSDLFFGYLFSINSAFTAGREAYAPVNVTFSYQPIGFLAANLLPAISKFALVAACVCFTRSRGCSFIATVPQQHRRLADEVES